MAMDLEALKQKRTALAIARPKLEKLEADLPALRGAEKDARDELARADVQVVVAYGTPGLEDDEAAARVRAEARAKYDAAADAARSAEEAAESLRQGVQQLLAEIQKHEGETLQTHWKRSAEELKAALLDSMPKVEVALRLAVALEIVKGRAAPGFREAGQTLVKNLDLDIARIVQEGRTLARKIRAGAKLEEV